MDWSASGETSVFHLDVSAPMADPANAGWMEAALSAVQAAGARLSILLDVSGEHGLDDGIQKPVSGLVESADIFVVTLRALEMIWGYDGSLDEAPDIVRADFGGKNAVVVEHRLPNSGAGAWNAIAVSPSGDVLEDGSGEIRVIDSDGALGAFAAGYLFGCLQDHTPSALRYGNAAAALACSVPGTLNWFTRQDLESQMEGTGSELQR